MANGETKLIQKKAVAELRKEAIQLKEEFKEYLEDLELFSNPEFWEAIEEIQSGKAKKFSSVKAMLADLE